MALSIQDLAALSKLLDAGLALPSADRAAWVDRLDAGFDALRPKLRQLLSEADTDTRSVFDRLPAFAQSAAREMGQSADPALDEPPDLLRADASVGPYRLLREVGRGGMGNVWLAERVDGALRRQVALKLPHPMAIASRRLAQRWARERDILAALEHPHIARLYDAGVSTEGQPYLALEYVEGAPITVHCDMQTLSVRARVLLFLQALEAVQFAHARLVVHRDLKPSNIYVTTDGQVSLLDFGIAKLLDDGSPSTEPPPTALTELGVAPLTPDYASPEQIAGEPIGTASDVYSLGVVFYELLAGQRPYRLTRATRGALEEAILATDPPRPSRSAGTLDGDAVAAARSARLPALRRLLSGDLDNVALKALAKDPAHRYSSAEAFSQDLQRWLDGLPVQAHPASGWYRAVKFVRRHRLPVGAATLAVVSLGVGLGVALHQARLAEHEAKRAQAVLGFVVGLFKEAAPARAQGRDVTVRDLMARGERDLHDRVSGEPELQAELSGVLSEVYRELADPTHALPLAESRVELVRKLSGPDSLAYGQALADLSAILGSLGRDDQALALNRQARSVLLPFGASARAVLLALAAREGTHLHQLNRIDEAIAVLRPLVRESEAVNGRDAWPTLEIEVDLATALSAGNHFAEATAILQKIEPLVSTPRPTLGLDWPSMLGNIGYGYWQGRQWEPAERKLQQAIAEFDRLAGPRNSHSVEAGRTLGMVQLDAGRYVQASESFTRNTQRAVAMFGADDGEVALNRSFEVLALMRLNRAAAAEAAAADSVRLGEAAASLSGFSMRGMRRRLAGAMVLNGKPREGLALADRVVADEVAAKAVDVRHAATHIVRSGALRMLGRPREAAEAAQRAGVVCAAVIDAAVTDAASRLCLARARLNEALDWIDAGEPARAPGLIDDAQALYAQVHAQPHPEQQYVPFVRAQWLKATGDAAQAARMLADARERFRQLSGADLPEGLPYVF